MGLESGNIAYHYRELTANNPVNRLILAAYKRLCEKHPTLCENRIKNDERVYPTLKMLQMELGYSKTNVRNIVKENLRPVTHPYFSEYEALRKTCLKILRDENVWIFDAEDCTDETESLYMNVTELWEKFLESRLREKLEEPKYRGLELTTQGREQGGKWDDKKGKRIFFERDSGQYDKRYNKYSKPDFVLWREKEALAILDAKFKRFWGEFFSGEDGTNSTTINDDINKCIRDMEVFQVRRTGVIFPSWKEDNQNGSNNEKYHISFYIGKRDVSAPVFDMVRVPVPPTEKSFENWCKLLEKDVDQVLEVYLNDLLSRT